MVIKFKDIYPEEIKAPRGGKGTASAMSYLAMRGIKGTFKTFNMMSLDPNSAIGYHKHETDAECYLLIEGQARYNDNGEIFIVDEGDLMFCDKGQSHAIETIGSEGITFLAFIMDIE